MLSMYPLLKKDGLAEAYWALLLVHLGVSILLWEQPRKKSETSSTFWAIVTGLCRQHPTMSLAGVVAVHLATSVIKLSPKYPFLADAIMVSWSFLYFAAMFAYSYIEQYKEWKATRGK